jgi:Protein of unknown function (DUF3040)
MALDDAERRSLEEIERRLTIETPRLAKTLGGASPAHRSWVSVVPLAVATVVLLGAFAWMSAMTGSVVPLLLALPPTVASVLMIVWQRTAVPAPVRTRTSANATNPDGPPTWWFT